MALNFRQGEEFDPCSCISFIKSKMGRFEPLGYPNIMIPNAEIPWPGYAVLTDEGPYGHIALILHIEGSNLLISEANYQPCKVSTRSLDISDPRIRGFWY